MTSREAGEVAVVSALSGSNESLVAAALSGCRRLSLVRRCADVAELLAVAEAGLARVAVLGPGFGRLDADVVARLRACGCRPVAVVDPDRESSERLLSWGVPVVAVGPGDVVGDVRDVLLRAVEEAAADTAGEPTGYSGYDGFAPPPRPMGELDPPGDEAEPTGALGRVVVVWGTPGAPGRTTVAATVAAELAAAGSQVLLVDADTYAAGVAQVLGLLDEAPGVVAAVRAGLDGRLDEATLARLAPTVAPGLRVLTGLTRASRWNELRPAGLQALWQTGRRLVDHVVVDVAAPLEEDDELLYDTAAPRRNGAALDALRHADDVLVVGAADPVGLQRLVRALQDLATVLPATTPRVVVTKVRADAVGSSPRLRVREALERFAGVREPHLVPDDRPACDRALLAGRTLTEAAPDSAARRALQALTYELVPGARAGRPVRRPLAGLAGLAGRGRRHLRSPVAVPP